MRIKSLVAPVALSVALVVTAACSIDIGNNSEPTPSPTPTTNGYEAKSAQEIFDASIDALKKAKSFRMSGSGIDSETKESVELDMLFAGDDRQGSLTSGGISFELTYVDGDAYIKTDKANWEKLLGAAGAPLAPQLVGKQVLMPPSSGFALEISDLLDSAELSGKGDVTTVDGEPAIELKDNDGGLLYVSLSGEPYPIKIVAANNEGTINFLDIDKDVTIEAPSPSEVVDITKIS